MILMLKQAINEDKHWDNLRRSIHGSPYEDGA
jgi:hypothetical protein